jgi:hypothetical protein
MSKLDITIRSKLLSEQFREVIMTLSGSLDATTIPAFEREIAALIHLLLKKTFFNHRGHRVHGGELQAERKIIHGFLPFSTCCETSFFTPCFPWLVPLEPRRTHTLLIG